MKKVWFSCPFQNDQHFSFGSKYKWIKKTFPLWTENTIMVCVLVPLKTHNDTFVVRFIDHTVSYLSSFDVYVTYVFRARWFSWIFSLRKNCPLWKLEVQWYYYFSLSSSFSYFHLFVSCWRWKIIVSDKREDKTMKYVTPCCQRKCDVFMLYKLPCSRRKKLLRA